jgi:superfamily I DNA/RNA helicase
VILMTEIASRSYQEMIANPEDEARVWYVGVTRARQRLTVSDVRTSRRSCPWV